MAQISSHFLQIFSVDSNEKRDVLHMRDRLDVWVYLTESVLKKGGYC